MEKFYGGIDIHKESYVGCIMDRDGNITREHTFPSSKKAVERFLCDIPSSGITIAIEACGLWRGVYKVLTEMGYEVKLANPKKTHDIACKKKTDRVDAKILADLLRTNYLPEVWIPDEQTLRFRDLTRHKSNLTRLKTQVQCKIKSYLLRKGMKYGKLWNETAISKLAEEDLDIKNLVNIYHNLKEEEKDERKKLYYFSGIYGVIPRVFNFEYDSQLVFIHHILEYTYGAINGRLIAVQQGDKTAMLADSILDKLYTYTSQIVDKLERDEDIYNLLQKIIILGYTTTGNGYYLYTKGIIKI